MKITIIVNENCPEFYDKDSGEFSLVSLAFGIFQISKAMALQGAIKGEFRDPSTKNLDVVLAWETTDYDCINDAQVESHDDARVTNLDTGENLGTLHSFMQEREARRRRMN